MNIPGSFFEIRPVTPVDENSLLEVYRQCEDFLALGPVATASLKMVRTDLALSLEERGIFCGIYRRADQQMMGVVDFVPSGWLGNPTSAFLSLLMIAAPFRSQGLGKEVVKLVEAEILRPGGILVIYSGVQVNNPGAICFWQRMGYQIISEPELMPDGTTTYRLEKKISDSLVSKTPLKL
jgi:ribosomal protein S18 acetylase RimI-like enzyme